MATGPAVSLGHGRTVGRRRWPRSPDAGAPGWRSYGLATVDDRGRVADHAIVHALGWQASTRLHIRVIEGLVLVTASRPGVFTVTKRGHVRLPATVRHWCGVETGDRVLLAAEPTEGVLVVHPPAGLDTMLARLHAQVMAREAA
jgi:bifunctional DNA-binding transcriptional regulator/antitoxin component of YhaV-PrlF toxin-antitoxin module